MIYINYIKHKDYQKWQKIITIFNKTYNKDIIQGLQKYFSGKTSFDEFINWLFNNPREYDCFSLHKAIKGITSHIGTVIEIIVTMASFMLKQILQKYTEIYKGNDLIKDIESCSSGIIGKILIALIENNKGSKRWEGNNSFFCENCYDEFANGVGVYIENRDFFENDGIYNFEWNR